MSRSTLSVHDEYEKQGDVEKNPPDLVEDFEGLETIQRTPTTPPALITELDKGLIAWESQQDPENPLYWPAKKRRINMTVISLITFLSPLGSSIFAPGIALTMADLHESSQSVGSLMITIYLLGWALGPLFLAPLSEMYGRYIVVTLSSWFFVAFLIGCGFAQNMTGLIIMRFLAGIGGSAAMAIAPAIVADLYPIERRSFAMGIVLLIQTLSPAVGPICGGFIAQRLGWRWAYWILIIASGVMTILMTFFMNECYAPEVLKRKTRRLQKELGRKDLKSKLALDISKSSYVKRSLIRPVKLLTRSPIVIIFASYVAIIYGMLYLLFTTIPTTFTTHYNWSVETTGLVYISFAIGMCLSLLVLMRTIDKRVARLRALNNGVFEPEMRLGKLIFVTMGVGPSLILYGWAAERGWHWIVPILALIPFGFGMAIALARDLVVDPWTPLKQRFQLLANQLTSLFDGSDASIATLGAVIDNTAVAFAVNQPTIRELQPILEKALYGYMIPSAWNASTLNVLLFIATNDGVAQSTSSTGCDGWDPGNVKDVASGPLATNDGIQNFACGAGTDNAPYWITNVLDNRIDGCTAKAFNDCGRVVMVVLPGMNSIDGSGVVTGAWGGFALNAWKKNGEENGWAKADPATADTVRDMYSNGIRATGIVNIPVSSVGTNSGHGSNIDHESALAANRETDGIGSEQQITVTYAGSTEFGAVDSAMRVKTPVSNATGQQVALASYINPSSKVEWDRMTAYQADKVSVLVANVNNGPGALQAKEWTSVIKNATDHGKTVIGYVRTGYLGLSANSGKFGDEAFKTQLGSSDLADWIAQIEADVETWYRLYPGIIGGIFFDEVWMECEVNNLTARVYRLLSENTKLKHPGAFTVLNSGESIPNCFEDSADTLVTYERSYAEYLNRTEGITLFDEWGVEFIIKEWTPKDHRKYWHIIYNTPQDKIGEVVALAKKRHAGLIMVTSATLPNPYGTLPSEEYMKTLIDAVETGSPKIVAPSSPPGVGAKPSPPTGLQAIRIEYSSIELEWFVYGEAEVMVVYLNNTEVVRIPGYLNRVTIGSLAVLSKNLKFKVQAVSKEGTTSAFSNTIVVDTKALPDGGKPIVNITVTSSINQTKYEADILVPFTFLRVFIIDPDSNCTYPAYAINTDRGFVCAKWMIEGDIFYKYSGKERDPKTKFWPFTWTPSDRLNEEGKNVKVEQNKFHYTWSLPIGIETVDTSNFLIEGEGISPKTNVFRSCPCHWKTPGAIRREKDGALKYCEGKQKFCAYKCRDSWECQGYALFSRVRICDRAVQEIALGNPTYRANDKQAKPGSCSRNFFGFGCSVTIRGKDKEGRNCEINGDGLKQAYEDIKAGERGNCGKCPGSKDLGNGCSVIGLKIELAEHKQDNSL
ncbi:hypothetical protein EG328_010498 [Venturia inaequalis]|uniref:Major facilitator superfamily (MFS) profile domain-containing protein n=1 Tax=Venturia inaequalis TaxID=5025 RepID=A0A8H3U749_VENIN|nr:hypothetical protein EG328_010498 [Venturia inaequalis]